MITRKFALGLVAFSMAAFGCDDGTVDPPDEDAGAEGTVFEERDFVCPDGETQPCETTEPAHTEAERTREEPMDRENETLTFVLNVLSLPKEQDGLAAGFNLDGLDSGAGAADGTCEQINPDFESLLDPGHVGVDNALQDLLGTIESFLDPNDCPGMEVDGCLDALLQEQVNSGSVLLVMQVSGVDSLTFDSAVSLQLILAEPAGTGTACADDTECTTAGEACISDQCLVPPTLDAGDRIEAGQTFNVVQNLGEPVDGDIFDGRLRAQAEVLTLMINAGDFMLPLMVNSPEVRFDITAEGLANGQIGGYLVSEDIIEAASMIMPGIEDTVRGFIEQVADIDPMPEPDQDTCQSLSVGITFGAVSASVAE